MYSLYATLPPDQAQSLREIMRNTTNLMPISAKALFAELQHNGIYSSYFSPIKKLFAYLFGSYNQTVVINNHLVIGNGIDLTANPSAIALFSQIDPSRDWRNLLTRPSQPNPPLLPYQIDKLLCASLTGVSNGNGTFDGYLTDLNNCLGSFSNQPLPVNQLLGLSSLVYHRGGTAPATLPQAIEDMLKTGDDLALMKVVMEYSNEHLIVENQNQLMRIGAIIHDNMNATNLDVHLSFFQEQRILMANTTTPIQVVGGPVKWGQPIGEFQENNFNGYDQVRIVPSMNPNRFSQDVGVMGTWQADNLTLTNNRNSLEIGVTLYGGAASDTLNFNFFGYSSSVNNNAFVYMAGNDGINTYVIPADYSWNNRRKIAIYDSNHLGKIYSNSDSDKDRKIFNGPIVDGKFYFSYVGKEFDVQSRTENDGTVTLKFTPVLAPYEGFNEIIILSYQRCQFDILPPINSIYVDHLSRSISITGSASPQGKMILFPPYAQDDFHEELGGYAKIYNTQGIFERDIKTLPDNSTWRFGISALKANSDGNFYIAGFATGTCKLLYTTVNPVQGTVASSMIDEMISADCDPTLDFPRYLLTAVDPVGQKMALVYLKKNNNALAYDLNVYFPSGNKFRFATVNATNINMFYSLTSGVTHKGFLVSSLENHGYYQSDQQPFSSRVFQFEGEQLVESYSLPQTVVLTAAPLKSNTGYFMVYNLNYTDMRTSGTWTNIFSDGKWLTPYQISRQVRLPDVFYSPQLNVLEDDKILLIDQEFYHRNYIFNSQNQPEIGPFFVQDIDKLYATATLVDSNVLLFYSGRKDADQRAIILPTSCLFQQSHVASEKRNLSKKLSSRFEDIADDSAAKEPLAQNNAKLNTAIANYAAGVSTNNGLSLGSQSLFLHGGNGGSNSSINPQALLASSFAMSMLVALGLVGGVILICLTYKAVSPLAARGYRYFWQKSSNDREVLEEVTPKDQNSMENRC